MTFNEYQKEALRTASGLSAACADNLLLNGAMGLCGESGEFIDLLKKATFQGHELDKDHLAKELGDILLYLAVAAEGIGYKLSDVAEMNKAKLRERYPDGFDSEKSLKRKKGDV